MFSRIVLTLTGPFDLALTLNAAASFLPSLGPVPTTLRFATLIDRRPAIVDIRQIDRVPAVVEAFSTAAIPRPLLLDIAQWIVLAELDLRRFYRIAAPHPVMGPIARALWGLKPLRPASLFEMAIIAITEQQLSLAAAFHIRARVIGHFGMWTDGLRIFPTPDRLAKASIRELKACGLSRPKAEYVRAIAQRAADGALDIEALRNMTDAEAHSFFTDQRGFGDWSAQYILLRGLGRQDCLPAGDVGLRRVVGQYLARGKSLSPQQLECALSPFKPFRGLAAFYLSVAARLLPRFRSRSRLAICPSVSGR